MNHVILYPLILYHVMSCHVTLYTYIEHRTCSMFDTDCVGLYCTQWASVSRCNQPRQPRTSSSFILMSFSVSASGVDRGRMGMGLSIRLS